MQGNITKYFDDKKYGFIRDENKESRFFHISNCVNPEAIKIGAAVEFEAVSEQRGLAAKAVNIKN